MLEFDKDLLIKIQEKLVVTRMNSQRYIYLARKHNLDKLKKKSERLAECLDYWEWDKYQENKLLDLRRVNRCMDRFCPNCRSIALSTALSKFRPANKEMLNRGYRPYIITLTVPNVPGDELEKTIRKMNASFRKFNEWLYHVNHKAFKDRLFRMSACVKSLEVTIQKDNYNMYHPHFHCIAYLTDIKSEDIFNKHIEGPYSKRYRRYLKYSDADLQIMKLWNFAYENIRITNYSAYPDYFKYDFKEDKYLYYQCDIKELDEFGVYEVFKYTFKDSDIHKQDNFETLYFALEGKRLRQGHGELYRLSDLDCEGEIDKEKESIEYYLEKEETPEIIYHRELKVLIKDYHDYRKISRFKTMQNLQIVE